MTAHWISALGVLRVLLCTVIVLLAVSAPMAGGQAEHAGIAMWFTLIAPALAPMMFFVLMLDVMMTAIYRSSAVNAERQRLGLVLKIELVLAMILVVFWLPFIVGLLNR